MEYRIKHCDVCRQTSSACWLYVYLKGNQDGTKFSGLSVLTFPFEAPMYTFTHKMDVCGEACLLRVIAMFFRPDTPAAAQVQPRQIVQ
jgi:hypothetical protein